MEKIKNHGCSRSCKYKQNLILNYKMKAIKFISFVFMIAVLVLNITNPVSAASDKSYGWYCRHTKNGEIPRIDANMSFVDNYNCYYINKNATEKNKVIYLTFDAGYENGNVKKIVDTLKEKNVTGAFFVLENLITKNGDLVKEMAANGNLVCNHTAKHKDMTKCTLRDHFQNELDRLNACAKECIDIELAPFYRPPEGKFSEQNLQWADELGYKTVLWSFAYADWDNGKQPDAEEAISKIIEGTHNGEIILLHPTSQTNAEIMGILIDKWREMGYSFGSLNDLK